MNRNAHCRIPGCESLSEIKFVQTWHLMSEPEKKLVHSFAGPPGIEDAPRTDATRDLVVETSYPTHGSLRLTMARAFKFAGCHSLWDDFLNDDGIGDERVDQLPGLYMDDDDGRCETLTGAERLSASMIEAQKQRPETRFPKITYAHECEYRWSNALANILYPHQSTAVAADTVSPPTLMSQNTIHPTPELQPRPDTEIDVDATGPPLGNPSADSLRTPPPPPPGPPRGETPPGPPAGNPPANDEVDENYRDKHQRLWSEIQGPPMLEDHVRKVKMSSLME